MLAQDDLVNRGQHPGRLPRSASTGPRNRPRVDRAGRPAAASRSSATSRGCDPCARTRRDTASARGVRRTGSSSTPPSTLSGMTLEAAQREDPDRTPLARLRARAEQWRGGDGGAGSRADRAPGLGLARPPAGPRDDAVASTGRAPASAPRRAAGSCPAPSSSSSCAGSTSRPGGRRPPSWPPASWRPAHPVAATPTSSSSVRTPDRGWTCCAVQTVRVFASPQTSGPSFKPRMRTGEPSFRRGSARTPYGNAKSFKQSWQSNLAPSWIRSTAIS